MKYKLICLSAAAAAVGVLSGCNHGFETVTFSTINDDRLDAPINLQVSINRPADGSPTLANGKYPAIIYVHGGGWSSGGRGDYNSMLTKSGDRGFVAVSVDYRLTARTQATDDTDDMDVMFPWPAQLEDVKCAISWLKDNAATYNVDPNAIGLIGGSAGGQIALMVAETGSNEYRSDYCNWTAAPTVKAVVSAAGPADLETLWDKGGFARTWTRGLVNYNIPNESIASLENNGYGYMVEAMRAASPIANIKANVSTPILQIQASGDFLVQPEVTGNYANALDDENRPNSYVLLEGGDHGWNGVKGEHDAALFEWFDTHLKGL